jgi:flagellar hook-associated protein 2
MGQIQTSTGLITGIPILDTVDKLMAISARPRDLITARNNDLQAQQVAVAQLTSLVLGVKFATDQLGDTAVYRDKVATSSDSNALTAAVTGEPATGIYQFTPVRTAQPHQLLSSGVSDPADPLGGGSLTVRFGGFVDDPMRLDQLNGGRGVQRGQIRIRDRSSASAVIDLRFAHTIDDVLDAINTNVDINVTASAVGDTIQLTDHTSQSASNLVVEQVGSGATAADLGLAGIDVAAAEATGLDIVALDDQLQLAGLNDGNGIALRTGLADLEITFADQSAALEVDLGDVATLGELLEALNTADPSRLTAAISGDGDHLELTDLTSGAGTFSVASPLDGTAAEDLGITGAAVGGVITSGRLQGGLKTPLLSSLNGGQGLGTLGLVDLTDRSGGSASVDLSSAETLDDVVQLLNGAGVAIRAGVNPTGSGIVLTDTSGGIGNLVVANGDASDTADLLGIAVDATQTSVDGGSLKRQSVSRQTLLATLNGGAGVAVGSLVITDSDGKQAPVKLNQPEAEITTVGGVIDAVNGAGIGVLARINDTGDGILLIDTGGGTGELAVREVGSGTTAADLQLHGTATTVELDGTPTQVIDGSATATITLDADQTLDDLVAAINDLDLGIDAGTLYDGSTHRLLLTSRTTGRASRLQIDASDIGLSMQETSRPQDALLLFGSPLLAGTGVLISSPDDTFDQVIAGLDLNVQSATGQGVTVDVGLSDTTLIDKVQGFVDAFNQLRDNLDDVASYNEIDNTAGVLFGSNEALRVETELAKLVTGRVFGAGRFETAGAVGLDIYDQGRLSLDQDRLAAALAEDRAAVEEFFTADESGFASRFAALVDGLAGEDRSLLTNRATTLTDKIETNNERIALLNVRLDNERQRLLTQFYRMESIVGQMQNNLAVLQSFQAVPPLSVGSSQ